MLSTVDYMGQECYNLIMEVVLLGIGFDSTKRNIGKYVTASAPRRKGSR
ncbi:MAG: hypothetical protein GY757_26830 [bacterium]|nr:hypothetical protein [bacterium]